MAFLRSRRVIKGFTVPGAQPCASPTSAITPSGVSGPRRHSASMIWLSAPEIFTDGRLSREGPACRINENTCVLPIKVHLYPSRWNGSGKGGVVRAGFIWMALAAAAPCAAAPCLAAAQEAPKPAKPPSAKSAPHTVGEVVVSGQAAAVQTGLDRRSYSVSGDLQAQTGSIGEALRNVPSVTVDVAGNVALRGDGNVTILIDG